MKCRCRSSRLIAWASRSPSWAATRGAALSWSGLCGTDCEGYYFSTHYAADNATPVAKKFIDAYTAKYGNIPDDVAALTYDSFGLLWQAIQSAWSDDRQAIRDALAKIPSYEGVTGTMQFQEGSGDPIKSAVILQIKDGKFVFFANANP